ncbi:unnamed protein product [Bursaphelenchus xylophilus]|uniref:(pine wood nematode) hypothetical protein n=1 Tax=Bursaphelenchus xylophilus TaxID=6326 RepID=A0A1I7RHL9_BURXY|nr:unnamed protein product [Bursaphelenchus xylophilus]CAG9115605.1 unnamed protein product [Bursaphelenchus xylophilus]
MPGFLWILLTILLSIVNGSQYNHALFEHLFKNYRKEVRPIDYTNPSAPTNVTIQLYLKQIQKVVDSDQIVKLYCWLEMYWRDVNLVWKESDFNGTTQLIIPSAHLWRPDLLVYNNAHMNVDDNELETNAVIRSDGRVSVYRAMVTQITCQLTLENFPFDQQICFIMLSSWSYDGSGIMLNTLVSTDLDNSQKDLRKISTLAHYMANGEWYLNDFKIQRNLKYYECCPYAFPDLTYYFSIRRNPIYYLFTQLLPSTFISIITMIGSFTVHSSTGENEEKITLGVTAGMAIVIILMMVADKLPATSNDLPLLGKFYVGLIFIIFFGTVCTTLVLNVQMKGNHMEPVPLWFKRLVKRYRVMQIIFERYWKQTQKAEKEGDYLKESLIIHSQSANGHIGESGKENGVKLISHGCPVYTPTSHSLATCPLYAKILGTVTDIRENTKVMLERLEHDRRRFSLRHDWESIARGLDRIFLTIFVTVTTLYAFWLFTQSSSPALMITQEFMNQTSAIA